MPSIAPESHVTLEPGFRLDRYELLCPIAQGGMAQVWLARLHGKRGFEKLVAVKTILSQYATDLRFQQMFLDEARIASGIEHPNVAQIFDLGEHGDLLYLVMEWVDGESLSKLARAVERARSKLPIGIVARICADACAGLHAAHELADKDGKLLNVVHRDVSPQNILVSVKGAVKLIDFGIAKARDRIAGETSTGMFKGKILYMAPEQAIGKAVDRRADLWAIGAIMYHMFAGKPAYEGENQMATLHMLTDSNEKFEPLPSSIPAPLRAVVEKALVRDADERVATAQELGQLIEDAMHASKITTTSRDVAKYVVDQLKDRNEARRKAVDLALQAAEQRQKFIVALNEGNLEDSSTGARMARAQKEATPVGVLPLEAPSGPSVESLPASRDSVEPPSAATLGSATISSEGSIAMPTRRRGVIVGSVIGVAAVLLLVVGVVVSKSGASAASTPPNTTLTSAAPPPPSVIATAPPTTTADIETAAPSASTAPPTSASTKRGTAVAPPHSTLPITTNPYGQTPTAKPSTAPSGKKRVIDDGF